MSKSIPVTVGKGGSGSSRGVITLPPGHSINTITIIGGGGGGGSSGNIQMSTGSKSIIWPFTELRDLEIGQYLVETGGDFIIITQVMEKDVHVNNEQREFGPKNYPIEKEELMTDIKFGIYRQMTEEEFKVFRILHAN